MISEIAVTGGGVTPIQTTIAETALSWIGTPFFPKQARKGIGADCLHQALAIYQEAGALPMSIRLPDDYTISGGAHLNQNRVQDWLETTGWFARCAEPVSAGDLLAFRIGKVVYHLGIAVDSLRFVHNIRGYGSIISRIDDSTWNKRLVAVFRLKGPQ